MKKDDSLWKGLLEDVFDDFLLFFFKEDAAIFDLLNKGFEFLNNELAQIFPIDEDADYPKYVDKLVKVFTQSGQEEWILVHVEVRGYDDKDFAERMFTYFYRILDKYRRKVTCITIFTGDSKKPSPQQYEYSFLGTECLFKYNVYKIAEQNRDELAKSNNIFALVVLIVLNSLQKGVFDEGELLELQTSLGKTLVQKNVPSAKTRAVLYFLRYYVHFDNPKNVHKFDEEFILFNKNVIMGIEELLNQRAEKRGIEKGIEYSAASFVKSLLLDTDFDTEKIARLASVTPEFVMKIKETL